MVGMGAVVAAGTSGWIVLKSRQSAAEPPLAILHAGDAASRQFAFRLQGEMRKLGADEALVFGSMEAANETLRHAERGIFALVAAGPAEGARQLSVISEIREAAWHTTLWTQRKRVEASRIEQAAEFWYTSLASTLASASRGVFSAKMRANPGAVGLYEPAMEPWRKAGLLLPIGESGDGRAALPPSDLERVAKGMREALAIDPAFHVARGRLALTLAWLQRWDEAKAEALRTLENDERSWTGNFALGLVQLQMNDPTAGCRYLGRCLEVAPFRLEVVAHMPDPCGAAAALLAEVRRALPHHAVWLKRT